MNAAETVCPNCAALTEQVRVLTASEANYKWEFERQQERADNAEADLQAMTVDRNLWQEAHDDDCPNKSENERLKAQIAAYEMPVTDEELNAIAKAVWNQQGWGPGPVRLSEGSLLLAGIIAGYAASRKLPPPAITEQDAKEGM